MADFFCLDTSVLTRITKASDDGRVYLAAIGPGPSAASFQVRAEALSIDFAPRRQERLGVLLESTVFLDHSEDTDLHYAVGSRVRRRLKALQLPGSDASDGDLVGERERD